MWKERLVKTALQVYCLSIDGDWILCSCFTLNLGLYTLLNKMAGSRHDWCLYQIYPLLFHRLPGHSWQRPWSSPDVAFLLYWLELSIWVRHLKGCGRATGCRSIGPPATCQKGIPRSEGGQNRDTEGRCARQVLCHSGLWTYRKTYNSRSVLPCSSLPSRSH